jgi:hypothetical protein
MAPRFITIDRDDFCNALEEKGFSKDPTAQGELVYVYQHKLDPTMFVKIYTSLPPQRGDTRGCGKDAIRVLLIFKNDRTQRSGCLYKAQRVFRTGTQQGVIERTLERARDAYQVGIDRVKGYK